jgi:predicted enzyme related to lactoylglutathione lyase
MSTYSRPFSHTDITVPDLEKVAKFYSDVMDWYHTVKPTGITAESDTPIGQMCIDVFGASRGSFKIALLSTGEKIGVEMFKFRNYETLINFECWKKTPFHFCLQDTDIDQLVEKIVALGGKQRTPICEYDSDEKPYRMCYMEDPFGLIFEICSRNYELTYSQVTH